MSSADNSYFTTPHLRQALRGEGRISVSKLLLSAALTLAVCPAFADVPCGPEGNEHRCLVAKVGVVCDLEWSAIDFGRAEMHVSRRKAGKPATHPIRGDELRELRKLRKEFDGIVRFRERTRCAFHAGLFQLDDQAGWSKGRIALPGSCAHAAAQRRLQARR